MDLSHPENFKDIADSMGIALYQRFSLNEASLFLRCQESDIQELVSSQQLNAIKVTKKNYQFFGFQLLECILGQTTDFKIANTNNKPDVDRIIRSKEVEQMTGLGRTTIWRYEKKGTFPKRLKLGAISVGWKLSEVQEWIQQR